MWSNIYRVTHIRYRNARKGSKEKLKENKGRNRQRGAWDDCGNHQKLRKVQRGLGEMGRPVEVEIGAGARVEASGTLWEVGRGVETFWCEGVPLTVRGWRHLECKSYLSVITNHPQIRSILGQKVVET